MRLKINRFFKDENGSGLVLALMVLLVLSVLGSALGVATIGSYRLGDINQDSTSAYYIAEAGANMAYEELKDKVLTVYESSETNELSYFTQIENYARSKNGVVGLNGTRYNNFASTNNEAVSADIEVIGPLNNGEEKSQEYIIKSIGKVDGKVREVEKPLTINWKNKAKAENIIPEMGKNAAITFFGELQLPNENQTTVEGLIRHNKSSRVLGNNGKEIGNNKYTDLNFSDELEVTLEDYHKAFDSIFPNVNNQDSYNKNFTEDGNNIILDGDTKIEELNLTNNSSIQTNNEITNLWVDRLHFEQKASVDINPSNVVNIFVTNSLSFGNNDVEINQEGDVSNLNIFYKGGDIVNFPGKFKFKGSLFVKNADLNFSNDVDIEGMMITGGKSTVFKNKIEDFKYKYGFSNGIPFETYEEDSDDIQLITSAPALEQ